MNILLPKELLSITLIDVTLGCIPFFNIPKNLADLLMGVLCSALKLLSITKPEPRRLFYEMEESIRSANYAFFSQKSLNKFRLKTYSGLVVFQ